MMRRYVVVKTVDNTFWATIIWGPVKRVYSLGEEKTWSCVVLVRPSRRRLIDSKNMPHIDEPDCCFAADAATFLLVPGWCSVKVATPSVTRSTTPYLYSGYFFRKMVKWRSITGRSLHDLAKIKVK